MFWKKIFGKNTAKNTGNKEEVIESGPVKVVVMSDLGNIRTNNEDIGMFFRIADEDILREKGYMLVVADGMGGHLAGEVASRIAAETVSEVYFNQTGNTGVEKNLAKAFTTANKKIYGMAATNKAYKGMGTTCTALVVVGQSIYYGHAGDSRAYLIKEKTISRITRDHTYVQELVDLGEIAAEDAAQHPKRNILTNAMGTKPELRVDAGRYLLEYNENDTLLLCSDGLYEYLSDEELAEIVRSRSAYEAAALMIEEAKKRGGHDNITVVLAERTAADSIVTAKETRDFDLPTTREFDLP